MTAVPRMLPRRAALAEARDVQVRRGGRMVLGGVDLVVRAGEVVALVGPNGAGKSTLLHALSGDLPATGGEVQLYGAPLNSWSDADAARRRAVLPQRHAVGFPFTVEQVVRMGRAPWFRTDAAERDDVAVRSAMDSTEVIGLADRAVLSLSGGEAARAALARVLAQETQLLLLDEPTASLDLHHVELTLGVVRERVSDGSGAVVVLHDLGLAAAHADRIVVLDRGCVVADGPPGVVLDAALLSRVYQHPIEVLSHPRSGALLVLPRHRFA